MKITIRIVNIVPFKRLSDHSIKINGRTIEEAGLNLAEPGWDIGTAVSLFMNQNQFKIIITSETVHEYHTHHSGKLYTRRVRKEIEDAILELLPSALESYLQPK